VISGYSEIDVIFVSTDVSKCPFAGMYVVYCLTIKIHRENAVLEAKIALFVMAVRYRGARE
jgi:hypothetical protein